METTPKILIICSGGVISAVISDSPIQAKIQVFDWDDYPGSRHNEPGNVDGSGFEDYYDSAQDDIDWDKAGFSYELW